MKKQTVCEEAAEFLRRSMDWEGSNRTMALEDLRFGYGDQWPQNFTNQRYLEGRPWFVINETDSYVRQICNQQRQQRPRIKVSGVNTSADEKIAELISGMMRHIEQQSDADSAYDTAFEFAVRMGWGYWRLSADYCNPKSFDQDIRIETISNPFSVYFDPNSQSPDGSDAKECIITDLVPRAEFKRLYPGVDDEWNGQSDGDPNGQWITRDSVRVAEYYRLKQVKSRLFRLSDGSSWYEDEMPDSARLEQINVRVIGDRMSWKDQLCWYKVTASEVLEERELPGRYIPVIPVYGAHLIIDGRPKRFGVIRAAKDPQRMLNYWQTSVTEVIALAPKAKWLLAEGQDEGHENEWVGANTNALPVLRYKQTDVDGRPAPAPQRLSPEQVPEAAISAAAAAHDNLQRVLGMFDPAMRTGGNMSGKALMAEQQQSDMSNYHFYDNLTRSIKHTGRIILSWIPTYYGEERAMRIIGADGRSDLVTVNKPLVDRIENDVTVGEYDVVMETGPGYNSKRQESAALMSEMVKAYPPLMQIAGDLLFRNIDGPGMDIVADRMAAANPLAQIDDKSAVPPQAQMMIRNLQSQLQQAQQAMQGMASQDKLKVSVQRAKDLAEMQRTQFKEASEDRREAMRTHAELAKEALEDATWRHDIDAREKSKIGAEQIRAVVDLILQNKEHAMRIVELAHNQVDRDIVNA